MLENLDAINWTSLHHAYGSAADVPALLRALTSADATKRGEALIELYGNIWHQGTVYQATAVAVPFLYELLNSPSVLDRSNIAGLLACIASGAGYLEVHAADPTGEKTWRRLLAQRGKALEEETAREAAQTRAVRQAASARLGDLIPFLRDPEPEHRRMVAIALGRYPEHMGLTLPALRRSAAIELDPDVRDAIAKSIKRLERLIV